MEKWSRTIFIIVELILGITTAAMAVQIFADEAPQKRVAVIVEDSGSSKWDAYIKGLKDSARANNLHLVICNTDKGLNLEEERELMEEQRSKGVDGFILQPAVGKGTQKMLSSFKEPILLNESRPGEGRVRDTYALVSPYNIKMGERLGESILSDYNGDLKGKTIGIVRSEQGSYGVNQRCEGLRRVIEKAGGKVLWTLYHKEGGEVSEELKSRAVVTALAVMDTGTLEEVSEAAKVHDVHGAIVYGIGYSMKSVYDLESETIAGLVTADLYAMGYESVREMAQRLSLSGTGFQDRSVAILVPKKGELFTEKYQKFLSTMER